jgi:hypothetical protein
MGPSNDLARNLQPSVLNEMDVFRLTQGPLDTLVFGATNDLAGGQIVQDAQSSSLQDSSLAGGFAGVEVVIPEPKFVKAESYADRFLS